MKNKILYLLTAQQLADIDLLTKRYRTALFTILEDYTFDKIEPHEEREQTIVDFHSMAIAVARRASGDDDDNF